MQPRAHQLVAWTRWRAGDGLSFKTLFVRLAHPVTRVYEHACLPPKIIPGSNWYGRRWMPPVTARAPITLYEACTASHAVGLLSTCGSTEWCPGDFMGSLRANTAPLCLVGRVPSPGG